MTEDNAGQVDPAEIEARERQTIESACKLRDDAAAQRAELEEAIPRIADPRRRALAQMKLGLMLMTQATADAELTFMGAEDE